MPPKGDSRLRLGPRSGRKTSLGAFWGRFRVPRVSRDNVRTTYFKISNFYFSKISKISKIFGSIFQKISVSHLHRRPAGSRLLLRLHFTKIGEKPRNYQNSRFPSSESFLILLIYLSSNFHWNRTKIEDPSPHNAQLGF